MSQYQIKMSTGDKFTITEKEAFDLLKGDSKGQVGIMSLRGSLNMSHVVYILPEDKIDRSKMTSGILHDGTRVIKRFGEWKDANNPEVKLDYNYYPELGTDEVLTEDEYQNKKLLNQENVSRETK